jgi:hypothetical protein
VLGNPIKHGTFVISNGREVLAKNASGSDMKKPDHRVPWCNWLGAIVRLQLTLKLSCCGQKIGLIESTDNRKHSRNMETAPNFK